MTKTNQAAQNLTDLDTTYEHVIYYYDRSARVEVNKALRALLEVKSLRGVREYSFQSAAEINRDLGYHYTNYGETRIALAKWEAQILGDAICEAGVASELYGLNLPDNY
jgi:hypothetical protein